jgi:lysophospholipase L1-like esterase
MPKHKHTSSKYHYVALGDSLANGVGAPSNNGYTHQLSQLLSRKYPVTFSLFAVSGQTSRQLLRRWPTYQTAVSQADLITWNIGGNDIRLTWRMYGQGRMPKSILQKKMEQTLSNLQANWTTLATQLRQTAPSQTKIIAINIYNPYQHTHPATTSFITLANQALADICAKQNITVINAHSLFDHQRHLSQDKLHLNQLGYTLLAQAINQALHPNIITRIKYLLNRSI